MQKDDLSDIFETPQWSAQRYKQTNFTNMYLTAASQKFIEKNKKNKNQITWYEKIQFQVSNTTDMEKQII